MQRLLDASDDAIFENSREKSHGSWRTAADVALEFGRFSVLLRQRKLVADGVEIKLGTRAFDLLLALLEADGSLVTKDELFSRVWPGIVVSEENLKTQISVLRKALGDDRDVIHTEVGRGYRLTASIRRTAGPSLRRRPASRRRVNKGSVPRWTARPIHQAACGAGFGRYF